MCLQQTSQSLHMCVNKLTWCVCLSELQTKLLLADPGRMQRLMQAARQPQLLGNGPSTSGSSQGPPNVPR
jgi:hypothetical protein